MSKSNACIYIQTSKQIFKSLHIAYKVSCSAVAITSCRFRTNIICFHMGTVLNKFWLEGQFLNDPRSLSIRSFLHIFSVKTTPAKHEEQKPALAANDETIDVDDLLMELKNK